jgi:hypothetical protein
MSAEFHTLAACPLGKEPLLCTKQEVGWATELIWMLRRREKNLALPGIEPRLSSKEPTTMVELKVLLNKT